MQDQLPGVERHRQALARALGVPDNADAPVAGLATRAVACNVNSQRPCRLPAGHPSRCVQGFLDGDIDCMKLMVARHLLGERTAAQILEDDEMAHEVEKASRL